MLKKTKGIIAGSSNATCEAGASILREGGNAFDAAIAAMLTTFVVEPSMISAAGGGFMTAFTENKVPIVFDFFCQTPSIKRKESEIEFYPITVDFGSAKEDFHVGTGSMAVPGCIAGMFEIHKHFATLPLSVLAAPALQYAKEGFRVDAYQAHGFKLLKEINALHPDSKKLFIQNNASIPEGEKIKLHQFSDFLEVLVNEGIDFFYKGEIAQMICEACLEKGGHLQLIDFEKYKVIHRNPIGYNYQQHTLYSNPLPSLGGSLISLGLKYLQNLPKSGEAKNTQHFKNLIGTLQHMDHLHGTPKLLWQAIKEQFPKSIPMGNSYSNILDQRGSTTHFSVVDELGNAVGITGSMGQGSGFMIPGTDIMHNNMLGEAALLPEGFHSWKEDTRLPSMMSPTIVCDADGPKIVCGTGGAGRIAGAILQVLHYLIDHKLDIEEAINGPRLHFHKGVLFIENGFDEKLEEVEGLNEVKRWDVPNMFFGGVHSIVKQNGNWKGFGDRRRLGISIEVK